MSLPNSPAIFCCSTSCLYVAALYRHPKELLLWKFAYQISGQPSSDSDEPCSPSSPSSSASDKALPVRFMTTILSHSDCVIQFELWVDGERADTRFFAQVENREAVYLEVEREVVKKTGWAWGWNHIKLRCEHRHVLYVLKMLEKLDETGERKRRVNGATCERHGQAELFGEKREPSETREAMNDGSSGILESEDGNMHFDGGGRKLSRKCSLMA